MAARTEPAFARPATLAQALTIRAEHPDWIVLAGGTDLMVGAAGRHDPPGVLDLFGLGDLIGVTMAEDGVRIGAGTTYAALLESPVVGLHLPLLTAVAREIGAVQIQERGTIGGNVMTSSPVGDMLPALLALDADVELGSVQGARRIPYEAFCTGYRTTGLAADELLVAVVVPLPLAGTVQRWRKVGTRHAQAISKVALAATARLTGGSIVHARIALGAVADRPVRLHGVEAGLVGRRPGSGLADEVRTAVAASVHPIDDVRSTASYRRAVAANLVARFVTDLAREGVTG